MRYNAKVSTSRVTWPVHFKWIWCMIIGRRRWNIFSQLIKDKKKHSWQKTTLKCRFISNVFFNKVGSRRMIFKGNYGWCASLQWKHLQIASALRQNFINIKICRKKKCSEKQRPSSTFSVQPLPIHFWSCSAGISTSATEMVSCHLTSEVGHHSSSSSLIDCPALKRYLAPRLLLTGKWSSTTAAAAAADGGRRRERNGFLCFISQTVK